MRATLLVVAAILALVVAWIYFAPGDSVPSPEELAEQALNAARARGGVIDEGNLIYLFDMGINSAQAQAEIYAYLKMENKMMDEGQAPTHEMTMQWLEACADKFQGDAVKFAERRGFTLYDEKSLNTKLLDNKEKTDGKQNNKVQPGE